MVYPSGRLEEEVLWFDIKAQLLDHHDSILVIVESYCIEILKQLGLFEKANELQDGVATPVRYGDYESALNNVRDFVLGDPSMFNLFPWLVDKVEPALALLAKLSDEFGIP